jgi:hypothetical protein
MIALPGDIENVKSTSVDVYPGPFRTQPDLNNCDHPGA